MRYLLTSSLLSAWKWFVEHSDEERSIEDIRKTFAREKITQTEAMKAGIEFEADVYQWLTRACGDGECEDVDYWKCVEEIAGEIRGGCYQVKSQRELVIGDRTYLLYGRIDALKADTIYDIKFTGSPYEIGKYYDSPQHRMYFYILPEVPRFVYLTSDGKNVWQEEYRAEDCGSILPDAADFDSWLRSRPEYRSVYEEKWQAYS
jgi:hypothetical protein